MTHRIILEPAYLLHSRPYQETSLIIELFSKEQGRFSAIAKGARRPKSSRRGLLQAFVPLLVSCIGRGELLTLTEVETFGTIAFLQGRNLISGFYLNELLMRLLHRFDPHPELFANYCNTITILQNLSENHNSANHNYINNNTALENNPVHETNHTPNEIQNEIKIEENDLNLQIALRLFEKNLLKELGYALQLTREVGTNQAVIKEGVYIFAPERGPSRIDNLINTQNTSNPNNNVYSGEILLALAEEKLTSKTIILEIKRLMRQALSHHLGDRPLMSRQLL